jgi:hypothetical protein
MVLRDCDRCGERISALAPSCARCGAPNKARAKAMAVLGSLAVLIVALAIAAVVILGGRRPPLATHPGAGEQAAPAADPFAWLVAAMNECEAAAVSDVSTLRFLVIPLASPPGEDEQWQAKSINDVGNATLLSSDAALDALRRKVLKIYSGEYAFLMRDQASATVYKWKSTVGVANFSTADADSISGFRLQFQTPERPDDANWGAAFSRQKGTCYWVNAILGH